MKKIFITPLLFAICIYISTVPVSSQAPDKMSFQAVVRNSGGTLVSNQSVGMRISILQGSPTGTVVFQETYSPDPQTNANGLVTLNIGGGSATVGSFSSIDWSSGPYFLMTETDISGGTNYTISGTSQLLSVPYAMYSRKAESATETDPVFTSHPAYGVSANSIANWNSPSWIELRNIPVGLADGVDNDTWMPNTKDIGGIVPAGGSNYNRLWKTDAAGNPSWGSLTANDIPGMDWNKIISGKPNTLEGYGITNGMNTSHTANGITSVLINNWNLAYTWGNHALEGYARYPEQSGNAGKILSTDGSSASWITPVTPADLSAKISRTGDVMTGELSINNLTDRTALELSSNSHTELRIKGPGSYLPSIIIGTPASGPNSDDVSIQFLDINYGPSSRLAFHVMPTLNVLSILGNGRVGIRNTNPSTELDVNGVVTSSGGFLPPRLTKAQRDALSPAEGLVIYNLETHKPNYFNGVSWNTFDGTPID